MLIEDTGFTAEDAMAYVNAIKMDDSIKSIKVNFYSHYSSNAYISNGENLIFSIKKNYT